MSKEIKETKDKNWSEKIRAYALKNALAHEGKAAEGSVISSLFHEGLKKEEVKDVIGDVKKNVKEINSLSLDKQEKEFSKLEDEVSERPEREGLPELPNVPKTGVVMRFAPAASGQLHLGHILTGIISSLYVKKYGGKFYIRIEDTDPERTDPASYSGFKEGCDWVFGNVSEYIIQSDRMEIYYNYAEKLIKSGNAYVCSCKQEDFKKSAEKMKDCPCRAISADENIERWNKMLAKGKNKHAPFNEGDAVLRFKTSEKFFGMANPNPAMRDFPLARINLHKHPRQGNNYRVWPLMNLSVSVDDIEYKMTHVIRAKEHRDNSARQKMIYSALELENNFPWTFFMGRYKFTDLILSKRKIKVAIEAGEFEDWDDQRLATLSSLRKRGYKPEAFAKLAEIRGLSEVDKVMSQKDFFKLLDDLNKEV